jgi:Ca-activated chloride channel family protein
MKAAAVLLLAGVAGLIGYRVSERSRDLAESPAQASVASEDAAPPASAPATAPERKGARVTEGGPEGSTVREEGAEEIRQDANASTRSNVAAPAAPPAVLENERQEDGRLRAQLPADTEQKQTAASDGPKAGNRALAKEADRDEKLAVRSGADKKDETAAGGKPGAAGTTASAQLAEGTVDNSNVAPKPEAQAAPAEKSVEGGVEGGVPGGSLGGTFAQSPEPSKRQKEKTLADRLSRMVTMTQDPSGRSGGAAPSAAQAPSTGGEREPNDAPYGDVFFQEYGTNPFVDTDDDRLSTFGLDVDTGSYTIARRYLSDGNLPPRESIRVEEFVNAFSYGDRPPSRGEFAIRAEAAPTPFMRGEDYRIVRFNIRGKAVDERDRKPAVLTFVVDVSGSMAYETRLELVKKALNLLLSQLRPSDRVGLVVYGTEARRILDPTSDIEAIREAIARLRPEGSTNAEAGLRMGYEMAAFARRRDSINRVILCSDGVANVGRTGPESILAVIEREAKENDIELTTVGFGMGNYNDVLMEQLANKGDGRYAYVDTLEEARRLFVEELTGTLQTIATDAKVQVEFEPSIVSRWRLIGYENRDVADHKFRDDSVDAGEIGAGHSVTALYEIKLAENAPRRGDAATLRLRYRSKETGKIVEIAHDLSLSDFAKSWESAPRGLRLASVVAEFAEVLKGGYWAKEGSLEEVSRRARSLSHEFSDANVTDLASLAGRAARLKGGSAPPGPEED